MFVAAPCTPRCQNGGLCIARNVCKCPPEYMGERCQYPLCRPPCINDGHCVRPNVCMCSAAWKGDHCQKPVCHLPCLNGGRYAALSHGSCINDSVTVFFIYKPPHYNTFPWSKIPPSKYLAFTLRYPAQQYYSQLLFSCKNSIPSLRNKRPVPSQLSSPSNKHSSLIN